ncbi:hypothetical protein P8C59_006670 [Phyllachora maydis]|uniref:Uncharacterized protein n=1 Tax=Phyllachora maydis TaxID=1825666 RepID=A0AAD9I7Z4_9PEZI|nr:hypothetical protein P8C59_006670 [Phyllachora maydis]
MMASESECPRSQEDATKTNDLDEETCLQHLTENVRDQDDLERDISLQANRALIKAEDEKDRRRIERAELTKARFETQKRAAEQKLRTAVSPAVQLRHRQEVARIEAEMEMARKDISDLEARILQRHQDGAEGEGVPGHAGGKLPNETQREFLLRTGKITPFSVLGGPRPEGVEGELADAILDAEDEAVAETIEQREAQAPRSHRNLRLPGRDARWGRL